MTPRQFGLTVILLLAVVAAFFFWPRTPGKTAAPHAPKPASTAPVSPNERAPDHPVAPSALPPRGGPGASTSRSSAVPFNPADFPIAAGLNAPDSTITRDLDILQQVFDAWRSNLPREGNPVGENPEITAALTGENRLGLALIPRTHPAINERGELCDRWGTPFRFHQLSGERMEVRSAGPDRKFATEDDAVWTPN